MVKPNLSHHKTVTSKHHIYCHKSVTTTPTPAGLEPQIRHHHKFDTIKHTMKTDLHPYTTKQKKTKNKRKTKNHTRTGEQENSGAGDVVRRANHSLIAPPPSCSLHLEGTVWIGEGNVDLV
jgi:hypothetical protein